MTPSSKTIQYKEGDWFAVPLRVPGFALGLVARGQGEGVVLGYFFGPIHTALPTASSTLGLTPDHPVLVRRFGDLGLIEGVWPIIDSTGSPAFRREVWRLPIFCRPEELTGRHYAVYYADDDPNLVVDEVEVGADQCESMPSDGLLGAGAVERLLTALLVSEHRQR